MDQAKALGLVVLMETGSTSDCSSDWVKGLDWAAATMKGLEWAATTDELLMSVLKWGCIQQYPRSTSRSKPSSSRPRTSSTFLY